MKELNTHVIPSIPFTSAMMKKYTILIPDMVHIHFQILENVFKAYGYNVVILNNMGPQVAEEGLKYVH
ncbi:MAG: 2-hydroxyglutaryl-CoA dehydratase, partial [Clostridia bacterium]|nr:2-hydroxyglutaryl-CoA dehydratase [Clostridia bacterium]